MNKVRSQRERARARWGASQPATDRHAGGTEGAGEGGGVDGRSSSLLTVSLTAPPPVRRSWASSEDMERAQMTLQITAVRCYDVHIKSGPAKGTQEDARSRSCGAGPQARWADSPLMGRVRGVWEK